MFVGARWTRRLGGKRSFAQTRKESSASSSSFCCPSATQPGSSAQRGAEGRREGAQPVHAILVGEDVLGDLVNDEEERGVRAAELQHVADGGHGLLRRLGRE